MTRWAPMCLTWFGGARLVRYAVRVASVGATPRSQLLSNGFLGLWRSLVAHLTGGQGVAGSNPVSPTNRLTIFSRDQASSAHAEHHLVASRDKARIRLPTGLGTGDSLTGPDMHATFHLVSASAGADFTILEISGPRTSGLECDRSNGVLCSRSGDSFRLGLEQFVI
jgi:hypothetical protein